MYAHDIIIRSQIVFEVKPWEAGADLEGLFKKIREEKIDGLTWGEAFKLVPVAFGVKKLVLSCVVVDSKVRTSETIQREGVVCVCIYGWAGRAARSLA